MGVIRARTGEIWLCQLDPTVGHEQGGRRPVVVVSSNGFNSLPIDMRIVVPLTGTNRELVTQPPITGTETGLNRASFARPEDVRAVSAGRLQRQLGQVSANDMDGIRRVLRYFLDL